MPEVWFIRHAESESNADLPTKHPAESALTEKGQAEAEAIVDSFTREPSLIVISPYLRARQTAEPTTAHFPSIAREEWPVHEFTYLEPKRYLNTTATERRPYALEYWRRNDPKYKDGGVGESFAELMARVQDTLERVRRQPAEFIAIFSHGLFLRALVRALLTGSLEATSEAMESYVHFVQSVSMPNGAIIKARFTDAGEVYFTGFVTDHLSGE